MWAVLDLLGAVLLGIFLVSMVVAAWEHFAQQSEQAHWQELPAAEPGDDGTSASAPAPRTLASETLLRLGQGRRSDPNWMETRPMVSRQADQGSPGTKAGGASPAREPSAEATEVDLLVE